jgi:hypothetical protein
MRRITYLFAGILALLLTGCVEERVVWSPDGTHALVMGADGLHICDAAGAISPLLVPEVKSAQWFPDGKRIAVAHQAHLATWDDAAKAFPDDAAIAVKNLDAVRADLLGAAHGWTDFQESTIRTLKLTQSQFSLSLMNLRDKEGAAIMPKLDKELQTCVNDQQLLDDQVQVYDVNATALTAGPVIYRRSISRDGVQRLRISPTGAAVAISVDVTTSANSDPDHVLIVAATDNSGRTFDCGPAADFPDWSPDGQNIIFIRPYGTANSNGVSLGVLTQHQVVDPKTGVIDSHTPWSAPPTPADDLAGMLFDQSARVRIAKDGRIFFSAMQVTLPTTIADLPGNATIFSYDPAKQSTLTRVIPLGAVQNVGDAAPFFELSPDARYLSIPFSDGRVSILNIATGDAQIVQPVGEPDKQGNVRLAMVPVWRANDELTFARPAADGIHHEVVRYSVNNKTSAVLSSDWPEEVLNMVNKPTTQP